jgi:hypothetical protein
VKSGPSGFTPPFVALINEEMGKVDQNSRFVQRRVGKSFLGVAASLSMSEISDDADAVDY